MKKTAAAVVPSIIALLFAMNDAYGDQVNISLGRYVVNSDVPAGEIGYEHRGWEVTAGLAGDGSTAKGRQDTHSIYSVSRLIRPQWFVFNAQNYYRIGVAKVQDSPLVGNTNYRLGVGFDFGNLSIEYSHYSSAGIYPVNRGIDIVMLRIHLPK